MQPNQPLIYPSLLPVVEDPCSPTGDFLSCDCLESRLVQARFDFLSSLFYGLMGVIAWEMQEEASVPNSVGNVNLHYFQEADHPFCWSPRTAGHCRWALQSVHTASPSCHHNRVPTREQGFHHSFPRWLLSYFPISNSCIGKSGLSPRKHPAEVLCCVLSHPQAVRTTDGTQGAGKKS